MDLMTFSGLTAMVGEKLEVRSKRIGIPQRAYYLKETEPGREASLFICGGEDDDTVEILRLSCHSDGSCSAAVRQKVCSASGSPKGFSGENSMHDGWHGFDYKVLSDETAKCISLYAADILEHEFGLFETNAQPFDCCSRQYTCSIRGECMHPDQLYAKACLFRKTLPGG